MTRSRHDGEKMSTLQQLAAMSFTERLKAAIKGSREVRAILIRDTNKMISAAVLSGPQVTPPEVESFARMANVSEDILRVIGNTRAWIKNYGVVVALTKNPKTPIALSLNLMARLHDRDLATLSVDRNVPDPLRVAARRRVMDAASTEVEGKRQKAKGKAKGRRQKAKGKRKSAEGLQRGRSRRADRTVAVRMPVSSPASLSSRSASASARETALQDQAQPERRLARFFESDGIL